MHPKLSFTLDHKIRFGIKEMPNFNNKASAIIVPPAVPKIFRVLGSLFNNFVEETPITPVTYQEYILSPDMEKAIPPIK
ncbi:hypothetical protein RCL_jg28043.t1 [Rhizophagus clarus]|uniref:Uncharacterized protein n=1 Tax=Rhizophagus clarus TaxID=94130 RepID=A0A8H3M1C3_9GLOM|nr:hypothetical protein RCL_jg28043.t1 [Rhizophagus clarus]